MSAFDESLHSMAAPGEVAKMLRSSGTRGILAPRTRRWTSFVIEPGRPSKRLVDSSSGWLAHYTYAGDHGWALVLYHSRKVVLRYDRSWDPPPVRAGRLRCTESVRDLLERMGLSNAARTRLEGILTAGQPMAQPYDRAHEVGSLLGWSRFEDFSFRHAVRKSHWCEECRVGSLSSDECAVCATSEASSSTEEDAKPLRAGKAFEVARALLEAVHRAGAFVLRDGRDAVPEAMVENFLRRLGDGERREMSGADLAEWLIDQEAVEDVYADDATLAGVFASTNRDAHEPI
ncbi:MAG: hypothetical protein AAGE52_40935 [Myxococcota bacterium]